MKSKEGIKAASATYRKATSMLADAINIDPESSDYPSEDFQDIVEQIPEQMKEKALKWYEMGIKMGIRKATNFIIDGKIEMKDGILYSPKTLKVNVKTKFAGEDWEKQSFKIKAEEIGFE